MNATSTAREHSIAFGWKRRVKPIRQVEVSECGLACLAMVANFYGKNVDLPDLRRRFPTGGRGSSLRSIMSDAEELGFTCRPLRSDISEISMVALPCIAHVDMKHYVVIDRVKGDKYSILDPASGAMWLPTEDFSKRFTGVLLEMLPSATFRKTKERAPSISAWDIFFSHQGVIHGLVSIFSFSLLIEMASLATPFLSQVIIDRSLREGNVSLLIAVSAGFLATILLQNTVAAVKSWWLTSMSLKMNLLSHATAFGHLIKLPSAFFQRRHLGDITSKFSSLEVVQSSLSVTTTQSAMDIIFAIVTGGALFYYSPLLAAVTYGLCLALIIIKLSAYRVMKDASTSLINLSAKQESMLLEAVRGEAEIKVNVSGSHFSGRYANSLMDTANASARVQSISVVTSCLAATVASTSRMIILVLGALFAIRADFTIGKIFAFAALSDQFLGRLSAFTDFLLQIGIVKLHLTRASDILMHPKEAEGGISPLAEILGSIEFENVSFRYGRDEPWVLENCSFKLNAGEELVIVGRSGGGKSTLIKLAVGLLEPTQGRILIDGKPMQDIGKLGLRRASGVVMQENILFSGSISDNISMFDIPVDESRVHWAAKTAGIHDEIMDMPLQYATTISDMGANISGGQRQRITLARAVYRNPRFLFMDEPTSHVDPEKSREIGQSIKAMDNTRLVISHRPDLLPGTCKLAHLNGGKLEVFEKGAPHFTGG